MLSGKDKITSLKGKSEMNTSAGKDITKIKVKNSGVNMPSTAAKPQSLKARSVK